MSVNGQQTSVVVSDVRDALERALFDLGMGTLAPVSVTMRFVQHVT